MNSALSGNTGFEKPRIHLAGCDALEAPPEDLDPLADISVDRDDLVAYALAVRPLYDQLGRLIGQLGGLCLMAQLKGRFEPDFDAVTPARERAGECADAIRSITAPRTAVRRHWALCRAIVIVNEVVVGFAKAQLGADRTSGQISRLTEQLKRANALVRWASDGSLGLNPIDFGQACCCCK